MKLEIVNKILIKLGCETVESLEADTKAVRLIKEVYEHIKELELQRHNWIFAKKKVVLQPENVDSEKFKKRFELPTDCLLLLEIEGFGAIATYPYQCGADKEYDVAGRYIYTNRDKIIIDYVANIDDSKLDVNFVNVFACAVAFELAEVITQSDQKVKTLYEKYLLAVKAAKRINATQMPNQSMGTGTLERSRL